jgi:hypothetical protein
VGHALKTEQISQSVLGGVVAEVGMSSPWKTQPEVAAEKVMKRVAVSQVCLNISLFAEAAILIMDLDGSKITKPTCSGTIQDKSRLGGSFPGYN